MTQLSTPESVISISADATKEIDNDYLTVNFYTVTNGTNTVTIQDTLTQRVEEALNLIKPKVKSGKVEVETTGLSVRPVYDKNGTITNKYQGSTSLVVKGTDTATISQLVGDIKSLTVQAVTNSVSDAKRKSLESQLVTKAIASFRDKSDRVTEAFGFNRWIPRDVQVRFDAGRHGYRGLVTASASLEAMGGSPMPTESGKTTITASVNGSIALSNEAYGGKARKA